MEREEEDPNYVFLSPAAVAERLGVSARTVRRWCEQRRIDHLRIGPRIIRISEATVRRILSGEYRP